MGCSRLFDNYVADSSTYALDYGNQFWLGEETIHRPQGDVFKPEEAWNVDTKLDDGRPVTGKFIMRSNSLAWGNVVACSISTSSSDYAGNYNLSSSVIACALAIRQ